MTMCPSINDNLSYPFPIGSMTAMRRLAFKNDFMTQLAKRQVDKPTGGYLSISVGDEAND